MAAAGGGPAPDDVPLDAEMIKVLAADTRRDILRLLQKRRMTLTEMATALDLKKATVLEHLKRLTDANLVRRHEDERLWVYYELTPQGGKLLNPGRTRFYLVMGIAAAAALLVGGLAATAMLDLTDHDAHVALQREPVAGNVPVSMDVRLSLDVGTVRAYLVTPHEADLLEQGEDVYPRYALMAQPIDGGLRLESREAVPPGDYLLYVQGEDADNRDALVPVHLARYEAFGPARATAGIDGPLAYEVTRDGKPALGALLLVRDGTVAAQVPIMPDGSATVDASTLDGLDGGTYVLMAKPRGSDVQVPLGRTLALDGPKLVVAPLQAVEGKPFTLTLALDKHAGPAPEIRVAGRALPARQSGGNYQVDVPALPPGDALVEVGRLTERLTVHADLRLQLQAERDGSVDLTVANVTGVPMGGVLARLEGDVVGRTDAEGRLSFEPPARADVATLVLEAGARTVERTLLFSGGAVMPAPVQLRVADVYQSSGDGVALVANDGPGPVDATLSAHVQGKLVAAQKARLAPGSVTTFQFDLPPHGGDVEVRVDPVRVTPIQVLRPSGPVPTSPVSPDQSDDTNGTATPGTPDSPEGVSLRRVLVPSPVITSPVSTSPTHSANGMPTPEVPFPWVLAPLALAGAALLLRRGRRGGGDRGGGPG